MSDEALIFWVAYQPNGEQKNYLGNGKGHVRLFKTEQAVKDYLEPLLTPEQMAVTVIHSVEGKIAVPEPEQKKPMPISTLAVDIAPGVQEQLKDLLKRKGIQ